SYTRRAVGLVKAGAMRSGRTALPEVVQYVPCVLADDGAEARRRAKDLVGTMLSAYWRFGQASAATRWAIAEGESVDETTFVRMMERLAGGESGRAVLDDRFLEDYAIAGTPAECVERCKTYRAAGVTELGIWFAADRAADDIGLFGHALADAQR